MIEKSYHIVNLGHGGISIFFITGEPQIGTETLFDPQIFSVSP